MTKRVCVIGCRKLAYLPPPVVAFLDMLSHAHPGLILHTDMAGGTGELAASWAKEAGLQVEDASRITPCARHRTVVQGCDIIVLVFDGKSTRTAKYMERAIALDKEMHVFYKGDTPCVSRWCY